jgi:polar amino acid transport system substrate-binding protein
MFPADIWVVEIYTRSDTYMYNYVMLEMIGRKISAPVVFIFLSILFLPALTPAENIKSPIVLNTAVSPPNSTPQQTGICDRVLIEAFKRIGVLMKIVSLPSERSLINANSGIDDGNYARVEGMDKLYPNLIRVPENIIKFEYVAFSKRLNVCITDWDSLKPYDVGIIRGSKILEANILGAKSLIRVKDAKILFDLLNTDKVDVIVYDRMEGLALLKELKYSDIRIIRPPLAVKDMYLYLHKKHKDLVPLLTDAIRNMKKDGTYNKILNRVLNDNSTKAPYNEIFQ